MDDFGYRQWKGFLLFLGTGSSVGVPVVGCFCGVCTSPKSHYRRLRSSGWLKVGKKLSFLIDAGPDFREQALIHKIDRVDGLLITHTHYDHVAGLNDLRPYCTRQGGAIPCLLSRASYEDLSRRYDYLIHSTSSLTARFSCEILSEQGPEQGGKTSFLGVPITYCRYFQAGMEVLGFRVGNFAYISDIREYEEKIFEQLQGVHFLVLSALRQEPSHLHLSIEEAIAFARKVGAKETRLTHLSHEVDPEKVNLPSDVQLGYDGLSIQFEV